MKSLVFLLVSAFFSSILSAQTVPSHSAPGSDAINRLASDNHDLLELLKKEQAVLEEMQADRTEQLRAMSHLEERLEAAEKENADLRTTLSRLQAAKANTPTLPTTAPDAHAPSVLPAPIQNEPAPEPESHLPPAKEFSPGEMGWHRLLTLKGSDTQVTRLFHITNKVWRVLWYNEDPAKLPNTSALFINAFPKNDTIPQQVCSKLGTGKGSTELIGPGNFYLKIEASGGTWETAVEDIQ